MTTEDMSTAPLPWWRDAVVYQVYPRSFADADGDGIGDLPGITSRLEHIASLGADAVWLSPFYPSPQNDAGYDVADYRDVDPLFGTLADFDALVATARDLGVRVVVDIVPNHTSSAHAWFRAAVAAGPGSPERDRYLFRDGRGPGGSLPPNNWQSVFGGDAWTRVTEADGQPGQWYLHLFDPTQPDLNWENPEVRDEFLDILRFWLDRGVAGFRVDVAHGLVKATGLPDFGAEQKMLDGSVAEDAAGEDRPASNQGPMWDQDGVHEIVRGWRSLLDSYDGDRSMVAEAWVSDPARHALYLRPDEYHQAFNFNFISARWRADEIAAAVDQSIASTAAVGSVPTWALENHDIVRLPARLGLSEPGTRPNGIGVDDPQPDEAAGLRRARAMTLLAAALPGSLYVYQGQELGLPEHTTLPDELRQDPTFARSQGAERGRDGCRVPLPWHADAPGFGFGPSGRTWLPQPEGWAGYAADVQERDEESTLHLFRRVLALRAKHRLGAGPWRWLVRDAGLLVGEAGDGAVRVALNTGGSPVALPGAVLGEVLVASETGTLRDGVLAGDSAVWLAVR
ncbi:glycoside hydrolase family 13 protein [Cellulomonas endometrii]|uniref:glycoside hydrolase family 13 protein n=1 Tax=Cellulomonas endometrii TaxID=3036301 RepID=UPI0024AE2FDF|nr:glycoside hydrolase family 13 protein [Cellulomonas endometrii]